MNSNIRKITCVVLAGVLAAQAAGCAKSHTEKEINELAVEYCNAVVCLDVDAMIELSEDLEDRRSDLERELTIRKGDVYTEESAQFVSAIADTLDYEIDKDSVSVNEKKGTAEVTVTFEYCDYEELIDDVDITDIDQLTDAVSDAQKTKTDVTIEFSETDDGWKVTDTEEVIGEALEFTSARFISIGQAITGYEVYAVERDNFYNLEIIGDFREMDYDPSYRVLIRYEDNDIEFYGESMGFTDEFDFDTNVGSISADKEYFSVALTYNTEISDPDFTGFYATVEHDGEIVESFGDTIDIRVSQSGVGEGNWNGDLIVSFYEPGGCLIWQGTVTVV
ncbi:hypothetical protein SAMN05216413_1735 [Ruminococcaceae bacterium KH2T8]|nr:hypothetical protein SAMN05216413_1735 [Ruminococcaceae bacterium KH2T8]